MDHSELKHKTFHAVVWSLIRVGGLSVLTFTVFTVLARVLSPHEFGLFALAILVVELSRILATSGLPAVVLQDKSEDWVLADTAFWANFGLSCIISILIWFLTPFYARLVGQPEIIPILRVLILMMPSTGLSSIHSALNIRNYGYKAVAARVLAANGISGAVGIGAALMGYGIWSLVIQMLIMDVVGTIGAWHAYPWMPRFRFDWRRLWRVSGLSASLLTTAILASALNRMQDIIIARFLTVASVGTYRIAWRMIDLIGQMTVMPIVDVSFVTLSKLQDDRERFRKAFLRMLGLAVLVSFPAISGFGILADDIIPLLFGHKWVGSIDAAKILSLLTIPYCLNFFVSSSLGSIGKSAAITKLAIINTGTTLVFSLIAAPFGLEWIAVSYVARSYLMIPYSQWLFKYHTGIGYMETVKTIAPPFIADQIMLLVLFLVMPYLHQYLGHGVVYLAAASITGCITFFAGLTIFSRDYVRSNVSALIPFFKGDKSSLMEV